MPAELQTAYVYVLVRDDLPKAHQLVQACHATLAATNSFGSHKRTHPHLVLCAVEDEETLAEEFNRLKGDKVPCCAYYEPDFPTTSPGGQLTAVATAPLVGVERTPLRKLKLLR